MMFCVWLVVDAWGSSPASLGQANCTQHAPPTFNFVPFQKHKRKTLEIPTKWRMLGHYACLARDSVFLHFAT